MVKKYSIAEARDKFTRMVHEAEQGATVELLRRGKPVAILLAVDEYERLSSGKRGFWQAYQEFLREVDLKEADIDAGAVFGDRDRSPGRGFEW